MEPNSPDCRSLLMACLIMFFLSLQIVHLQWVPVAKFVCITEAYLSILNNLHWFPCMLQRAINCKARLLLQWLCVTQNHIWTELISMLLFLAVKHCMAYTSWACLPSKILNISPLNQRCWHILNYLHCAVSKSLMTFTNHVPDYVGRSCHNHLPRE